MVDGRLEDGAGERMKNKNVVVIGATGIIGKGAALAFAEAGARVVMVSRSMETIKKTISGLPSSLKERFIPLGASFSNTEEAGQAKVAVENLLGVGQTIDHLVVSVGNVDFAKAPSEDEYSKLLDAMNEAPRTLFFAAKVFLPAMKNIKGSSFTTVSGVIAFTCPAPSLWSASVKYAAINLLMSGFHSEFNMTHVRVNTIVLGAAVAEEIGGTNKIGMEAKMAAKQLGEVFVGIAMGSQTGELLTIKVPDDLKRFVQSN